MADTITPAPTTSFTASSSRLSGRRLAYAITAIVVFAATVVAANALTAHYGLIPVGFGLAATAGTWAAGLTLLVRDWVHQVAGRTAVYACISAGTAASALLAGPRLAAASAVAFAVAELADLLVYQRLRDKGALRAALASNSVSAPLDTLLFLTIAGLPLGAAMPGQLWVKAVAAVVPVGVLAAARTARRRLTARSVPHPSSSDADSRPDITAPPNPAGQPPTAALSHTAARQVWTGDSIRALGATTSLSTAADILGLSAASAYRMARNDTFPVPVLRVGRGYRVPVAPILAALHLSDAPGPDPHPATPPPASTAADRGRPHPDSHERSNP